jgi:hypothetical protein
MSAIITPTANSIAMDNRRPIQLMAPIFVAFVNHLRVSIQTLGEVLERGFAEFAGLPYHNASSRQQWEELWEAEPYRCGSRLSCVFSAGEEIQNFIGKRSKWRPKDSHAVQARLIEDRP